MLRPVRADDVTMLLICACDIPRGVAGAVRAFVARYTSTGVFWISR